MTPLGGSKVRFAALVGGWLLAAGARAVAQVPPQPAALQAPLAVTAVAPGVFVQFGALEDWPAADGGNVANLGFVVGSRCVAVIDTGGTPDLGRRWRAAIERETSVPICYVIHTHAHPDHVLGDAAFIEPVKPGAAAPQFVASARFSAAMAAREPYFLNVLKRDFGMNVAPGEVVVASVVVDGTLDLDLGGRMLTLRAWPTAHTDNDLTVYDRATRTLFASDLLFVQHLPVIDGSLRGWLAVMDDMQKLDVALVVPGHGPASRDWPAALAPQRAYLGAVLRDTRAAIKRGETLAQAVDHVQVPPGIPGVLADRFHRRNVTTAYAELEWEQ